MSEQVHFSDTPRDTILAEIDREYDRISQIKSIIIHEKLGWPAIVVLIIAILLNITGMITQTTTYMLLWISASLYFYIFYPMLPLFLFPFRFVWKQYRPSQAQREEEEKKESIVRWARNARIFSNKRVGFRLFMRFFIISLIPLTIGMLCIYLFSMAYSLLLGYFQVIPDNTSQLILIQCLGIVLFYIEIFFFRHHLFNLTRYIRKQKGRKRKELILLVILGLLFLIIGTVVIILLLIAILLPGFTLVSFINVSDFVKVRTNLWVLLLLITQIIIMQFLQNRLSLKVGRDMCDDLMNKLKEAREKVNSKTDSFTHEPADREEIKEPLALLRESKLYAINRRQMFRLFPTYSIGINLPALFSLRDLRELEDVFPKDE
ncbi:MAG: hypothetical protein JXA44_07360 [Methanospirillaceae archaeon]|nr:hypothetical protein [Methanospirillaceae archaeon]